MSDLKIVFEKFNYYHDIPESIYEFSDVFNININEKNVILKRTRSPLSKANEIIKWLDLMQKHEIKTVYPISLKCENPQEINEDVWVCYPFINGKKYSGNLVEIEKAGELLGKIHVLEDSLSLNKYTWPELKKENLEEDIESLKDLSKKINVKMYSIISYLENYSDYFNNLKSSNLPYVNCTWDYKANNLIYQNNEPILIDPDSGGNIPRIFDLALAVLLFHNELDTAPGRMFTEKEWNIFKQGYFKYIHLNENEVNLWKNALIFMFMEEAVWLLLSDEEGWNKLPQKYFLKDLISFDKKKYLFEL